jgi:hypothetical protein
MHPALRATLRGDANLDDSDSDGAVDELLHRSPVRPDRHNSGSWSSHRRRQREQKLRSPGSVTPGNLTPTRPLGSGSSTLHRPAPDGQEINGHFSRVQSWQGDNRYVARNTSDDDESNKV